MKAIRRTSQFKRDVKRMQRQGRKVEKPKRVLEALVKGEPLAAEYRDHVLVGQYKGTRECNIEPDWLLICEIVPLSLLKHHANRHAVADSVHQQVYRHPYPKELMLPNHV